jgi:hypothetical protein
LKKVGVTKNQIRGQLPFLFEEFQIVFNHLIGFFTDGGTLKKHGIDPVL